MGLRMRKIVIALVVIVGLPLLWFGLRMNWPPDPTPWPPDLKGCAAISNKAQRLAAYDHLALVQRTEEASFSPEGRKAAQDALKAIRKVQTATSVGINKVEYSRQVIEMAQTVQELALSIPEGVLKQLILESSAQYVEAQNVWDSCFQWEYVTIFTKSEVGKRVAEIYGIRGKDLNYNKRDTEFAKIDNVGAILRPIWSFSGRRVRVAGALLKRNAPNDLSALAFVTSLDKLDRAMNAGEPVDELKKAVPKWDGEKDLSPQ